MRYLIINCLTLCNYSELDIDNEHDAFDDACACADLLKEFVNVFELNLEDYVEEYQIKDTGDFVEYVSSVEFRRELNTLYGVLCGIELDNQIVQEEHEYIVDWLESHRHYIHYESVGHIIKVLKMIWKTILSQRKKLITLKTDNLNVIFKKIKSKLEKTFS